ncbi:S8 family peptidase [Paenibacillus sp. y28]|uniref:S8 family peptidase n=1 Tax=Paenibacillus sp. y28 TaxID=3129110 RepID=UPI0030198C2A
MDYSIFLHKLHEELRSPQHAAAKHFIRFPNEREFTACLHEWQSLQTTLPGLAAIHPLPLIHAFSCSLPKQQLPCIPHSLRVEADETAHVHFPPALAIRQGTPYRRRKEAVPWGIRHIQAPKLWEKATGRNVHIGVIDTGVDFFHPDLRHAVSKGINVIHRSMLPYDDNGHGTHIAGTIAASGGHQGMTGVAPDAIIHPVKTFDHQGTAYVSDIIAGIDWCVRNQMDIINMSFGMKKNSRALHEAVRRAVQAGIVVVASSGNDGKRKWVDFPARFPQTISVGAINKASKIAAFSNRGQFIDIYAPGDNISSTWLFGKYNELSGTSMATSHVSGVIALLLEMKPSLRPTEIKTILKSAAGSLKGAAPVYGGEVNAMKAIRFLKGISR